MHRSLITTYDFDFSVSFKGEKCYINVIDMWYFCYLMCIMIHFCLETNSIYFVTDSYFPYFVKDNSDIRNIPTPCVAGDLKNKYEIDTKYIQAQNNNL